MKSESFLGIVPIVGIRWWLVENTTLYGIGNFNVTLSDGRKYPGPRYRPGKPLRAACLSSSGFGNRSHGRLYFNRHPGLDAPQLDCQCGIYAVRFTTLRPRYATNRLVRSDCIVQGEVFLWGHIIEHREGWRAQYAQVKAFHEELSCITPEVLYDLAEIYHVPVVSPRATVL